MLMIEAINDTPGAAAETSLAKLIPEQERFVTDIQTVHKEIFAGVVNGLLQPTVDWGTERVDPVTIARIVEADGLSTYEQIGKADSVERQADADYVPALRYERMDPEDAAVKLKDIPEDRKLHLGHDHWLTMDGPVSTAAIRQDRLHLQHRMEALIRDYARDGLQQDYEPVGAMGSKALLGTVVVLPNVPPRL